jgi:hypothetical protein
VRREARGTAGHDDLALRRRPASIHGGYVATISPRRLRSVAIARMVSESESPANVRVRDNRLPERRARALEVEVICSDQAYART